MVNKWVIRGSAMRWESARRVLLCSWLGHKFTIHKMYDDVCARCRTSRQRG